MDRIVVTGANGAGKSHFARRLAAIRPNAPIVSLDALKLRTSWRRRPESEVRAALDAALAAPIWILEGGPSLLGLALAQADAVVWLDPPGRVRAWRLLARPWRHLGRTRPELPPGNVDWPWRQYRFALRSLRRQKAFRAEISSIVRDASVPVWRCRREVDLDAVLARWGGRHS